MKQRVGEKTPCAPGKHNECNVLKEMNMHARPPHIFSKSQVLRPLLAPIFVFIIIYFPSFNYFMILYIQIIDNYGTCSLAFLFNNDLGGFGYHHFPHISNVCIK